MYVPLCMSFWYILWILIVWMSMKALPCTVFFFLPCTNKLYFVRKSFASHFPSTLWDGMLVFFFFCCCCFLEEFSPFTVCVLCSDLIVLNTPFHCTVTLKSPFVFLASDGFCSGRGKWDKKKKITQIWLIDNVALVFVSQNLKCRKWSVFMMAPLRSLWCLMSQWMCLCSSDEAAEGWEPRRGMSRDETSWF